MFNLRDSFVMYSRYYVWDWYYAELMISMKANNKYIVEVPKNLFIENKVKKYNYDFTYYLGSEELSHLKIIANLLIKLKDKGYSVCVRPHPRFSSIFVVNRFFKGIDIQNGNEVTIEESIKLTKHIVAINSTVMFQGWLNDVPIVIDDVSDIKLFNRLKDLNYFILSKKYRLLSEFIH